MPPRKREDEPIRPPIAFAPCSNGEFSPRAAEPRDRRAHALFLQLVEEKHRRLGMTRREFAESACGVAAALSVMNLVYGCSAGTMRGGRDAGFNVTPDMTEDAARACEALEQDTFVFDVQLHPPNPLTPWTDRNLPMDAETFIRTAFIESETTAGVLSGVPDTRNLNQANLEANRMLQELIDRFAGHRLICHANVDPSRGASELDYMQDVRERFPIAAWKVYPHVGRWRLDSEEHGLPFLQRSRELGVKVIAAHRGIADDSGDYTAPSTPADLVAAASAFPELQFLTYHSGWQSNVDENHPFDPADPNPRGVDRLIKAALDHGIGPGGNVYAELGSTWRNLMTQPQAAAHVLGKLLLHLGEDRGLGYRRGVHRLAARTDRGFACVRDPGGDAGGIRLSRAHRRGEAEDLRPIRGGGVRPRPCRHALQARGRLRRAAARGPARGSTQPAAVGCKRLRSADAP
jgi:hypothetical protein